VKKFAIALVVIMAAVMLSGCSSLPIKVNKVYNVAPGKPVGLQAPSNMPAVVMEIDVSVVDLELPPDPKMEAWPPSGQFYLIYGAEKAE
jgi:hypothetical protein